MSPPVRGANPRGPTYAGRASPRPSPPLPLASKSGSLRQRITAATHHGGDEIAAQPRPRYFKIAPPALIRKKQRTSSVPVAGRTASHARPPPQRANARKPSISAGRRALSVHVSITQRILRRRAEQGCLLSPPGNVAYHAYDATHERTTQASRHHHPGRQARR